MVKEKKYEAFGNLVWEEGTYENNREFTGKEKEPTGFHYFGARRYYANIGRFLTPDPHTLMPGGFELTDPQTLNPYVYCTNNPLYYVDPDGKERVHTVTGNEIAYTPTVGGVIVETIMPFGGLLSNSERAMVGDNTLSASDWISSGIEAALTIGSALLGSSAPAGSVGDKIGKTLDFAGDINTAYGGLSEFRKAMVDRYVFGTFEKLHPDKMGIGGTINISNPENRDIFYEIKKMVIIDKVLGEPYGSYIEDEEDALRWEAYKEVETYGSSTPWADF